MLENPLYLVRTALLQEMVRVRAASASRSIPKVQNIQVPILIHVLTSTFIRYPGVVRFDFRHARNGLGISNRESGADMQPALLVCCKICLGSGLKHFNTAYLSRSHEGDRLAGQRIFRFNIIARISTFLKMLVFLPFQVPVVTASRWITRSLRPVQTRFRKSKWTQELSIRKQRLWMLSSSKASMSER